MAKVFKAILCSLVFSTPFFPSNASEHRIHSQCRSGLMDTLSWKTLEARPSLVCAFYPDDPPGDSVAMWFQPLAACTLKTIRIWQRTQGVIFTVDVYRARYDGHIMRRDSTNAKGWIGYNEDGQWVPGWRLGHPPLGEHIWGPFPLTLLPDDPDWIEIPTRLVGEPSMDGSSFFISIWVWGVVEPVTFVGGEDENSVPYHFFHYFPSETTAPGKTYRGWYLMSSSLWIEAIVSYSANTPPFINNMSVQNDTYGRGPYSIKAEIEDWDVEDPERAGISSAYLVWDVNGITDSTLMSYLAESDEFCAEIPSINVDDAVRYHISATDSAGARSANMWSAFNRLAPQNPDADILVVSYERSSGGSQYAWIRSFLDSLGYQHEDWNIWNHKGIDESIYKFGWSTAIPFGQNVGKEGLFGPFPTRGYEGNIWADFLASGTATHPANVLYIPESYITLYENCDENPERFFGPGDFPYDYFGLLSSSCRVDDTWLLVGVDGDPVSGEFFNQPFKLTYHWPLSFERTIARNSAAHLFVTEQDSITGVRYDAGNFRTVYLPWTNACFLSDDSTFSSSQDFLKLTNNILEWFGTGKGETRVDDHMTTSFYPDYALFQNYPNPFNSLTTINLQIPMTRSRAHVTLKIYNILGQQVRTLVDEMKHPGHYAVTWDGRNSQGNLMASGVYMYRLEAGSFIDIKRMVLMK